MRKKRFQVGSVAVLFSVVVLCVAVFAVLIVVLLVKPAGLLGKSISEKV